MTLSEAKDRFRTLVSPDDDVCVVIQEVVDRAFDMGRWRGMVEEVSILTTDYVVDEEENEIYLDFDIDTYNGAIGFRVNDHSYDIYGQTKLFASDGSGKLAFIDKDEVVVGGTTKRRYRCPSCWSVTQDCLKVLLKKTPPTLGYADEVPIKSVAALKRAIFAVTLENVDDFDKADQHWAAFMTFMDEAQKEFVGNRKYHIRIDAPLRHKPTGFM